MNKTCHITAIFKFVPAGTYYRLADSKRPALLIGVTKLMLILIECLKPQLLIEGTGAPFAALH